MILKNLKKLALIALLAYPFCVEAQPNFSTKNAKISFFSSTPIEDIKAASNNGMAVLVTRTRDIIFQVPIKSFEFAKGLMQEHFNENYMESDKYPIARFKGKINQAIDFSKDGEYPVSATGNLSVHGVEQPRTINGKLMIKDGKVALNSSFDVKCVDHNIKIPKLVMTKIAEVISVKVDASLAQTTK